jgi:ABC-type antimicrobial peptide transport system permease subunit
VALGASRGRILSGVVRRGLTASVAGLAIGLGLWWAGRNRLGEVLGAPDAVLSPFALATTSALILGLTLVAVALPGLRASRVDPLESLQVD